MESSALPMAKQWCSYHSMKRAKQPSPALVVLLGVSVLLAGCATPPAQNKRTLSSFDPAAGNRDVPAGMMNFVEIDLKQVLEFYQEVSGCTVIRSPGLPQARITVRNQQALNRVEVLRLLDTVLAKQGVAMVFSSEDTVKALPAAQAAGEAPPEIRLPAEELPDSSSFMLRTVKLQHRKPEEVVGAIQPFAHLPNSIIAVKGSQHLLLRDYSSNVKAMLRVISAMDVPARPSR